ncbi:hypothetical protein FB451DRAFT_572123 [Mycena latifolia]|nr:hypothetical protein FB451DRAFT_572123 [Mycena latifolia]
MSDASAARSIPGPPAFVPQAPFDNLTADVTLTSSDGVDFHVHRIVLSLVSPVFKAMFKLPQPRDSPDIPTIPMAESALVLDRMLRFCYPGAEATVNSINELREILEVAVLKYDIQYIVPVAKKYLEGYIDSHPLAAFAIACRHEWKDLAKAAARSCLRFPIRAFASDPAPELGYITAKEYHKLLQYHAACSAEATTTTTSLRWISAPPQDVWFTCSQCPTKAYQWYLSDEELWPIRDWFLVYMKAARKVLKIQPLGKVDDPSLMHGAVKAMTVCPSCREEGFEQLQKFATEEFGPQVVSAIDKVALNLSF